MIKDYITNRFHDLVTIYSETKELDVDDICNALYNAQDLMVLLCKEENIQCNVPFKSRFQIKSYDNAILDIFENVLMILGRYNSKAKTDKEVEKVKNLGYDVLKAIAEGQAEFEDGSDNLGDVFTRMFKYNDLNSKIIGKLAAKED